MDAPNSTEGGAKLADLIEVEQLVADLDDPEADDETVDEYSAEQLVFDRVGIDIAAVSVARRRDIPLKVVNDLVNGWIDAQKGGDWTMDTVHWCARHRGKGNRSWFVATLDPADDVFRVWRVSRGGHGKSGPTVTEQLQYRRVFVIAD